MYKSISLSSKKLILNSFLVALLLSANAVVLALPISGIVASIMVFCIILSLVINRRVYKAHLVLISVVLLAFMVTYFIRGFENSTLNDYFIRFVVMGVAGLILSQYEFDIKYFFYITCVFSLLLLPFFLLKEIDLNSDINYMGLSYGVLKMIVSTIAVLLLDSPKKIKIAMLLVFFTYMSHFILFASRGAFVSIFFFLLVVSCLKLNLSYKKVIFLLPILFFFIYNFDYITHSLQDFFSSHNVSVYALDKFVVKSEIEDIDNGRFNLWGKGFDLFANSPLFGLGVAAYEIEYHSIYVHNVFLEMLIEGGILLLGLFLLLINYSFIVLFDNKRNIDQRLFVAFLFSTVIIPLCFSETFWHLQYFWFYIGYMLTLKFVPQRKRIDRKSNFESLHFINKHA